jgi:DNA-binding transcriptional MerR regulator
MMIAKGGEKMSTAPKTQSKTYSIGQVHAITGIPKPTIRFWEKEFSRYLTPQRTSGNQRRYNQEMISRIEKINFLVKVQGYTIDGAKKKIQILDQVIEKKKDDDPMRTLAQAMSDYLLKRVLAK